MVTRPAREDARGGEVVTPYPENTGAAFACSLPEALLAEALLELCDFLLEECDARQAATWTNVTCFVRG